jgi:hypothetical protein
MIQVQYVAESSLGLFHSPLLFPRKRKRKKEEQKKVKIASSFSKAGLWLCRSQPVPGLSWPLCALKNCFKGWLLNFMCILCAGGNLIG